VTGSSRKPPNITIDSNIARIERLDFADVDGRLDELHLTVAQRQRVTALVRTFRDEVTGQQRRARIGELIEEFRGISEEAYAEIAKPLFLTFLRDKREQE